MTANHGDTKRGQEGSQGGIPAFLYGNNEFFNRTIAEALQLCDFILMFTQMIDGPAARDESILHKLCQGGPGEAFDVHIAPAAEVFIRSDMLRGTAGVRADQEVRLLNLPDFQLGPAAGAGLSRLVCAAFCFIRIDCRDNFVRLVHLQGIANTQFQTAEDIVVVERGLSHLRTLDFHRVEQGSQTDASRSRGAKQHAAELGGVGFILPFKCDAAPLMMPGGTQILSK